MERRNSLIQSDATASLQCHRCVAMEEYRKLTQTRISDQRAANVKHV